MSVNGTEYDTNNNGTIIVSTKGPDGTTTEGETGLQGKQIGIIVGVLVAVLLITAVVLFIIFRRRISKKESPKKATGGSEVYRDTTAPLDEESKGMLKSGQNGGTEQVELETKEPVAETEATSESSPLKEKPSATDS